MPEDSSMSACVPHTFPRFIFVASCSIFALHFCNTLQLACVIVISLNSYCFRETVEGEDIVEEDHPLSSLLSVAAAVEAKPPVFPVLYLVDRVNQNKM